MDEKRKLELPEVNEKHIAVICLTLICIFSAWMLGKDSVPIITGCAGAVGGFIKGSK